MADNNTTYAKTVTQMEPKMLAFYLKDALDKAKRTMGPAGPGRRWPALAQQQALEEIAKLEKLIRDLEAIPTPLEQAINEKGAR